MYVCVDFDGTCVTHEYPNIGKDIGAVPVLKRLVKAGHKLILFTMRSGKHLEEAVEWFKNNEIPLFGINTNPTQKEWTNSPKAYGHLYIDDAALGIPLKYHKLDISSNVTVNARPYVDWEKVNMLLTPYYANQTTNATT